MRHVPIVHTEGRAGDFKGVEVCGRRAAEELDWRPEWSLTRGVADLQDWIARQT